jgi:hypothetical protein
LGGLGAIPRLRWAGLPAELLEPVAWALYRQKHGLEARAVVALAISPRDALEAARGSLTPRHFLTAPYAAAVVLLLDPETPATVLERTRVDLSARPHLPSADDAEGWRAELAWCVAELVARRIRWDESHQEQAEGKAEKRARRKTRLEGAADGPEGGRVSRRAMRALTVYCLNGTEPVPELLEELRRHGMDPSNYGPPAVRKTTNGQASRC